MDADGAAIHGWLCRAEAWHQSYDHERDGNDPPARCHDARFLSVAVGGDAYWRCPTCVDSFVDLNQTL
jgi:hypothetical protein